MAESFVEMIIDEISNSTLHIVSNTLIDGPKTPRITELLGKQHTWFQSLSVEAKMCVVDILKYALSLDAYGFLSLLDGNAGSPPFKEKYSRYVLYAESYSDKTCLENDEPSERVLINKRGGVELLHEIYKRIS